MKLKHYSQHQPKRVPVKLFIYFDNFSTCCSLSYLDVQVKRGNIRSAAVAQCNSRVGANLSLQLPLLSGWYTIWLCWKLMIGGFQYYTGFALWKWANEVGLRFYIFLDVHKVKDTMCRNRGQCRRTVCKVWALWSDDNRKPKTRLSTESRP
jgi:hypothetical protein